MESWALRREHSNAETNMRASSDLHEVVGASFVCGAVAASSLVIGALLAF